MAMPRRAGGSLSTTCPPMLMWPEVWRLEAGDDPQQRGLAAARGAEQHDELAVGDVEVDALEHVGLAEGLADLVDLELGHDGSPYLTAPEVMPRISWRVKMR